MIKNIKIIWYLSLFIFVGVSCKKNEVELVFDKTPNERVNDQIELINKTMVSAEYGWKATVGTGLKGGYGFYFDFDDQQVVGMVADLTDKSAIEYVESNYRIKQDNGVTLIFDTYNYISMLNDPVATVYDGTQREGLRSDLEYGFDYANGDTLAFIGKRYRNPLVLIKATKEERDKYRTGSYQEVINQTKAFFEDNTNPYIDVNSDGESYMMGITINTNTKIIELASLHPDGTTSASTGKYAFSLDGLNVIAGGIIYRGHNYVAMNWEGNKMYFISDKGDKYEVKNSLQPILPLYKLIGSKYVGFRSPYLTYFSGTSSEGLKILERYHNGLAKGTGYAFNSGYMDLAFDVLNKRVTFSGFSSQNNGTSGWITAIIYNYELDEDTGIYKLTYREGPNGGYVSAIMDQMDVFLRTSRIKFDYHISDGTVYAKIIGVDKPEVEMTFRTR
ncbi:DUF4302 domain-containing protein [Sphingobacterium sp. UT-1RO-CII-1]|uniref:DUF4302 domain-containing protein n=1 Tax=Sphingobacterium sp. UT-1RO-CII-1 TaxID=2995225 RepID=UPI00227A7814|nr:DUF4302 domain-containing protein [Sphingobacterium sp. UT-1RO-CII-1]MCY4780758.1 DUF4302 domain-containing protein [Sphingobacterium sp. UT-1RO-CII-1]